MKKRILSTFLTFALLLTLLPTAVMAEGENTIYTQTGAAGDGSSANPYGHFEEALAAAKAGDTIVIREKSTLSEKKDAPGIPCVIDKAITIQGENSNAALNVRTAGILLAADVTMRNVELNLENGYHNAIFANGYKFTAENITRGSGSRMVHLFAGGLEGYTSNGKAVLSLTNSQFGNIYAGSMNEGFAGSAQINITNSTVGAIYGSGADEADFDQNDWFNLKEPPAPTANSAHLVSGPVNITVDGASTVGGQYSISVNGNGSSNTSLTINTAIENKKLSLADLKSLTINGGTAAVAAINETADVTLNNSATISFAGSKTVNSLSGNGKIVLGKEDKLTITGAFNGTHVFETTGGTNGQSGLANANHTYITAASGDATVNFIPYESQKDFLRLIKNTENGGLAWVTSNAPESKAYVEKLEIDSASKNITKTVEEINDETNSGAEIKVLIGEQDSLQEVPLTIMANGQNATTDDDGYVVGNMRLTAIDEWEGLPTPGVATISIGKKDNNSTIAAGTYNFTVTAPTANSTVSDTFTLTVTDGEGNKPQQPAGIHDLFKPKDNSKQEQFLAKVMNRMLYLDSEIDVSDIDISPDEIKCTTAAGLLTGESAARWLIMENPFHSTVSLKYGTSPKFDYKSNGNIATVKVQYGPSWTLDFVKRAIEAYDEAMSLIQSNDGDFAKILKLHDWIVKNVSYGMGKGNADFAAGALANRAAVCAGYADCYKFLLEQVGIENIRVNADTRPSENKVEPHAWNLVLFEGHYFHVDTTWDRGIGLNPSVRHDYFMLNDAEFNENGVHTDDWKAKDKNYPQGNTCYIENKFYQNNTGIATDKQIAENPIRIKHQYPANVSFKTSETQHWANCAGGTEIREAHNGSPCTVCGYKNNPQPVEKALVSIAITAPPTKTKYVAGENFDPAGMEVTAHYSDRSEQVVSNYTFEPTRALTTADTSITVSYTEGNQTATTTQAITVNAKNPEPKPEPEKPAKKNQAALVLSASKTRLVVGEVLTLSAVGGSTNHNAVYKVSGDGAVNITGSTLTATKAGTVTITASKAGNEAYNEVVSNSVTITITNPSQSGGGSSSGGSSSSGGGSSSGGSSSSGKVETTTKPNGTTVQTETKADGTKVETTTAKDGSTSKTTTNPNGSSVTENKAADGSTGTVKTDQYGQTTAETDLSSKAVETAKKNGEAVKVPVEVEATRNSNTAPVVNIEVPKSAGETKVEIPVSNVKPGTVAVLVHPDGTEEIIKNSVPTEDGIQLTVNGGATVKIVDNSKDFIDTREHWSRDQVNFVAARELFQGVGNNQFGVGHPMTRGMVNTVLARLAGVDTTSAAGQNWYDKGIAWARENGVSDGSNPNGNVTREQLATMLYRYAGSPAVNGSLPFSDADTVSDYAKNALIWATQNGILNGYGDGRIGPKANAERAQVAAMMARFIQNAQ